MLLTSRFNGAVSPSALAAILREDEQLVGAVNGVNMTFILPNGDKAINEEPGGKIKVSYNGQRLHEGGLNDFVASESVPGGGYDTITLTFAPISGDLVSADYIKIN